MVKLSGLDLRVFNVQSKDRVPHPTAVFVVPYEGERRSEQRINVLYGGVVPFFKMDTAGVHSPGSIGVFWTIDDLEVRASHDVQKQVDGYLSLLRNTEGDLTSVVRVENPYSLDIQTITDVSVRVYREACMSAYRAIIDTYHRESLPGQHARLFDPATPDGAERIAHDKTLTSYIVMAAKDVMDNATLLLSGKKLDKCGFTVSSEGVIVPFRTTPSTASASPA